jgi:hypothetical protein
MSLELQQYCFIKDSMMDRGFKKVGEVKPGESKGVPSIKANGSEEMVIFECEPDGLGTVYRINPDNTECEIIKRLGQGESLGIAAVRHNNLNINAEPALYNIIHR